MPYIRDGDNITLTMTSHEYAQLLFILGYATGARPQKEGDPGFYDWDAFVNRLNAGNPDWIPYEIPGADDARPSGLS